MVAHVPVSALHVIVDCDPGIDDAVALLMLANLHRSGHLALEAVVSSNGNGSSPRTAANAAFVLDRAGLGTVPVYIGEVAPVTPNWSGGGATALHGPDALGGLYSEPHVPVRLQPTGAQALTTAIRSSRSEEEVLLVTGPLTNLAKALRDEPSLRDVVQRVVVMGGAFGHPRGNVTPWAEFNFWADPVAAAEVCATGLALELVPLDVTTQVHTTQADLRALDERHTSELAHALIAASIALHRKALNIDWCLLHDAVALLRLVEPAIFQTRTLELQVTTTGDRAGEVRVRPVESVSIDTRFGSASVAVSVEAERARAAILRLASGGP